MFQDGYGTLSTGHWPIGPGVTSGILANQRLPISKFTRLNTKHTTTSVQFPQIRRHRESNIFYLCANSSQFFEGLTQCVYPNARLPWETSEASNRGSRILADETRVPGSSTCSKDQAASFCHSLLRGECKWYVVVDVGTST